MWYPDASSRLAITDMGRKVGAAVPLSVGEGELGPHLTQCGLAETYRHAKWHLDPSNLLAAIHQCHRQDRTDRQWSNRIG